MTVWWIESPRGGEEKVRVKLGAGKAVFRRPGRVATSAELEAFYRECFLPLVRRAIRRHRLSNDDARDIVQEAFVIALGKLGPDGNANAWLKQVVDNLAANLRRKTARRARLMRRWMPDDEQPALPEEPPDLAQES